MCSMYVNIHVIYVVYVQTHTSYLYINIDTIYIKIANCHGHPRGHFLYLLPKVPVTVSEQRNETFTAPLLLCFQNVLSEVFLFAFARNGRSKTRVQCEEGRPK